MRDDEAGTAAQIWLCGCVACMVLPMLAVAVVVGHRILRWGGVL